MIIIFGFKKKNDTKSEKKQSPDKEEKNEIKDNTEKKKLKEKYGVMKEIPERIVEDSPEPLKHIVYPKEEGEAGLHDLILRIEKMDGKLDIIDRFRDDVNERITQLAEEIGELRTMIMERERSSDKISTEFEKVKDTVSGLEPVKIKTELDKKEKEILENKVKMESLETLVKALSEENKKFRELMDKIKSFENLTDISYDIDRKVSKIKEVKDHADMIASKVENIFSEVNEKMSELENQRDKIEKLDELTIEMTKMLDEVSVKLTKFVEKKDLKQFQKEIEEGLNKSKKALPTQPISRSISKPIPITKPTPMTRRVMPRTDLPQVYSQISKLKSVVDSQNVVINNIIQRLRKGEMKGQDQDIRNIMLSLRFYQIMNILLFVRKPEKIKDYLAEVREIGEEMKTNGIWNKEKESYMKSVLDRLSSNLGLIKDVT